jgi:hypothetical protein
LIANTEKYRNKYEKMKKRGVKNKVALIATARACFWQLVNTVLGQIKIQNPGLTV